MTPSGSDLSEAPLAPLSPNRRRVSEPIIASESHAALGLDADPAVLRPATNIDGDLSPPSHRASEDISAGETRPASERDAETATLTGAITETSFRTSSTKNLGLQI
jgi:hypothetical protein